MYLDAVKTARETIIETNDGGFHKSAEVYE